MSLFLRQIAACIDPQEDEQQDGESPQRRTAITEERQRYADYRRETKHHAHVDEHMEEEHAKHTIAVNATEGKRLSLSKMYEPKDEGKKQEEHAGRTEEALLLTNGTENEVGVLLRHKLQFGLRAVKKTFAFKTTRPDGNLALMNIIARSCKVLVKAKQHVYAHTLVRLHNVVEHIVGRIEEHQRANGERHDEEIALQAGAKGLYEQIKGEQHTHHKLHDSHVEGYDIDREEERQEGYSERVREYEDCLLSVLTIDINHARREHLNKEQHGELAYRCGRVTQKNLFIFHTDNKIDNHGHTREEHTARHALTIEH